MNLSFNPISLVRVALVLDNLGMHAEADDIDCVSCRLAAGFDYGFGKAPQGEYWLRDGTAEYADGDVGDLNHEMIAEQHLLGNLGYDLSDDAQSLEDANHTFTGYVDEHQRGYAQPDSFSQAAEAEHGPDWHQWVDIEDYLRHKNVSAATPKNQDYKRRWFDEQFAGFKDPRTHAVKQWGWQRLQGKDVELWDLSQKAIENLARGLKDAYSSENGGFLEEDEDGNSAMQDMTFNIDIRSQGKTLYDVPFSEIEDGTVAERLMLGYVQQQAPFNRRSPRPGYNNLGD